MIGDASYYYHIVIIVEIMTMIMAASSLILRTKTSQMLLPALMMLSLSVSTPTAYGFQLLLLSPPLRRTTTTPPPTNTSINRSSRSNIKWVATRHRPRLHTKIPATTHRFPFKIALSNSDENNGVTTDEQLPKSPTIIHSLPTATNLKEIRNIANHLASQPLESLLSSSEAKTIMNELFFNDKNPSATAVVFTDRSYAQYVKYWTSIESRLRKEEHRTPADLLGKELTNRILTSIRGSDQNGNTKYDAKTVRTFLESAAINSLFTRLLYDAIFEFTTKFDILGNAISNLPLLGPVRNQVLKESKRNMDRTLGPLLRTFLSGYTRVAIRQAVEFVVSEENASAFGKANAKLVTYLLEERTVADWIPDSNVLVQWREEVWAYLVGLEGGGGENKSNDGKSINKNHDQQKVVEQSIDWIYDILGDKCIEDGGVNVNDILDASPTLEMSLGRFWKHCQDNSNAQ